jgi:flagellar basal body-associated protein FliL
MEERNIKVLIALFVVVVSVVIGYTFSRTYEKFENAPPESEAAEGSEPEKEPEKESGLTSRERELFSQIVSEKISNEALEKLIKAGQITESMVEKFLNEIDKDDIIEGFSSKGAYSVF